MLSLHGNSSEFGANSVLGSLIKGTSMGFRIDNRIYLRFETKPKLCWILNRTSPIGVDVPVSPEVEVQLLNLY